MATPPREEPQDTLAFELEAAARARSPRNPLTVGNLRAIPTGRDDLPLVSIREPRSHFSDLVLRESVRELLIEIASEHWHSDRLRSHGIGPRRRLLFTGPSGTGKTRSAEAMASELGIPVATVRLSAVVSSYLGETSRHLEQIMDFSSRGSWVLIFDEIDMFAAERDRDDHGEMRRVVAAFLQTLEEAEGENLVIATTNHATMLDAALWRRFDEIVAFTAPTKPEIAALLEVKLRRANAKVNRHLAASSMIGMTHAEVEMVCLDAIRASVLSDVPIVTTESLVRHAEERRRRLREAGLSVNRGGR